VAVARTKHLFLEAFSVSRCTVVITTNHFICLFCISLARWTGRSTSYPKGRPREPGRVSSHSYYIIDWTWRSRRRKQYTRLRKHPAFLVRKVAAECTAISYLNTLLAIMAWTYLVHSSARAHLITGCTGRNGGGRWATCTKGGIQCSTSSARVYCWARGYPKSLLLDYLRTWAACSYGWPDTVAYCVQSTASTNKSTNFSHTCPCSVTRFLLARLPCVLNWCLAGALV
jgi:hypothetical protein